MLGLKNLIDYVEVSTSLIIKHYTSHPRGAFYGIPGTPEHYRSPLGPITSVEGLYLLGQDADSCGIADTMMDEVAATCQILGPKRFTGIRATITAGSRTTISAEWPSPEDKYRVTLMIRWRLTRDIWEVCFDTDDGIGD